MFAENKLTPKTGRLLIAEPFLHDGYFRRSVILLAEHSDKGSVGFILNKPLEVMVQEAIPDFPEYNSPALFGGPVQRDQLYYIHTLGEKIEGSLPISDKLWWLGDFDQVKELISRKEIGADEIRFFIGYAGWGEGQLDEELKEKSWFITRPSLDLIFSDHETMWKNAVQKMGKTFAPMANFPEDPSLN
jgi:putative transcriptional regulator